MKNNFPPKLSNNSAIKDDAIIKSISICLALLLYTALNSCDTDNTKNIKKIQKDFISERLVTRDSPSLDTALVQQIKGEAQQVLGDTKTGWYLGLLHAMLSPDRHLPTKEHEKGSYRSIYIDSITYIIMEYDNYTQYPYGINSQYPYGINGNGQIVLNKKRIEGLCNGIGLVDDQKIKVTEAIWLQEIYEYRKTKTMKSTDADIVNLFGELVSLTHGGSSYLSMRMQTLNKPVLLLAKLQGQSLITETDLGGYDAAEKFYEDGMISYLKSTGLYDTFLQESIQGSSEYNNYLIKKYFSNTEKLYQTILGE